MRALIMAATLMTATAAAQEPDYQTACRWWTDLPNVITPVGWRDHLHRFNVLYDGTILPRPPKKPPRFDGEDDPVSQGVQLTFISSPEGVVPPRREGDDQDHPIAPLDSPRTGDQGWTVDAAPVLWTRWKNADGGIELRQLVFAHMEGGGESETGVEPMYAWIRLENSSPGQRAGFLIKLNAPHLQWNMLEAKNMILRPAKATYPRGLRFENNRIVEDDGRIRLGVVGGGDNVRFIPRGELHPRDSYLHVALAPSGHVDLLLPMIPADSAPFEHEQSLGRDGALAQANAFWSSKPATAASIHTPEPQLNAAIEHSVRLTRMISLTVPATRERTLISGSMVYSLLWITPTSMASHMLLDPLGWHDDVEKYLEIHRANQGKVKAPGPQFPQHPGYFGVPVPIDSGYQWLTDHGAVLYTASRHGLISGDEQFTARWTEPILRGCDFIRDCRRLAREAPQAAGVMPAASASDKLDPIQSFWSDAWNYKGIATAARLLRRIGHSRAEEIQRDADDYKAAIVAALRAKAAHMPKWKDRSDRERTLVPMSLALDEKNGYGIDHPFYLDTGPMFGVWAGVLAADDPLMRDAADFFREGPHVPASEQLFVWDKTAYLLHEMSSAEPCYSWNVFHSHALGERERYLQCMYSLFAGALSRQTFISCETRGGITENVFTNPLAVDLVRLAVVDDELEPDVALHLLRFAPLAWFSDKEETRFENMPTDFGPLTLKWQLLDGGKALGVEYAARFRVAPKSIALHVPPLASLTQVTVNGESRVAKGGDVIFLK
jgi:hypothetical protein